MQRILIIVISVFFVVVAYSCNNSEDNKMKVEKESFGVLSDGSEVFLFTINNKDGSLLQLTNFGAAVVALKVPDKKGKIENVVLGFDSINKYESIRGFYGATVGRYGNRIDAGKFSLNGKEYLLATNEGPNHLHGGIKGFDRVVWDYEIINSPSPSVKFSYLSPDGEEGYPGNFNVAVLYSFNDEHELIIEYEMTTDKPTVKNVTNHSYFNLSGDVDENILNHTLVLHADRFLPVDENLIPTGELRSVEGTPMDFTIGNEIGNRIENDDEQLLRGGGYDHCWVLSDSSDGLKLAAEVFEPNSGRLMKVYTTEPAIQFYSGNFMDGSHSGREGQPYAYRYAMCLETQHYPDSPNHPEFPSTVLDSGKVYSSKTIYSFSVK